MTLLSSLLDLLFPPKCPSAAVFWTNRASVMPCRKALPWDRGRGRPAPGPGGFRCAAPLWYQGLAREGLHRFKFRGMSSAAGPLGSCSPSARQSTFSGEFDTVTWCLSAPGGCGSGAMTRPGCWRRAPAACGTPRRFRCCARPSTPGPVGAAGVRRPAGQRAGSLCACVTGADRRKADPAGGRHLHHRRHLMECARVLREAGAEDVICAAVAMTPLEKGTGGPKNA